MGHIQHRTVVYYDDNDGDNDDDVDPDDDDNDDDGDVVSKRQKS